MTIDILILKIIVDNIVDVVCLYRNASEDDEVHFDGTGIIQSMQKIFGKHSVILLLCWERDVAQR